MRSRGCPTRRTSIILALLRGLIGVQDRTLPGPLRKLTCWYMMEMASVTSGGSSDTHPGTHVTWTSIVSPATRTRIVLVPIDLGGWFQACGVSLVCTPE